MTFKENAIIFVIAIPLTLAVWVGVFALAFWWIG